MCLAFSQKETHSAEQAENVNYFLPNPFFVFPFFEKLASKQNKVQQQVHAAFLSSELLELLQTDSNRFLSDLKN